MKHYTVSIRKHTAPRVIHKFMVGVHTLSQARVWTSDSNMRRNGDKKYYVPKCCISLKLWRVSK